MGKRTSTSFVVAVRNILIVLAFLLALVLMVALNLEQTRAAPRLNPQLRQSGQALLPNPQLEERVGPLRPNQQLEQERAEALKQLRAFETRVWVARETREP